MNALGSLIFLGIEHALINFINNSIHNFVQPCFPKFSKCSHNNIIMMLKLKVTPSRSIS